MANVIPFEYEANEMRVVQDENGVPWVVAKDVCEILDLSDVSMSLEKLDEDEKLIQKLFVSGQERDVWTVSESGLYTLIIRSNKPEARKFRRWVTHEVLPSLRKTGAYVMAGGFLPDEIRSMLVAARRMERTARIFKATLSMAKTAGMEGRRAILRANEVTVREAGCDCLGMLGYNTGPQVVVEDSLSPSAMNDFNDLWRDIGECTINVVGGGGAVDQVKVWELVNPDRRGERILDALEGYGIKLMEDGVFVWPTGVKKMLLEDTGWQREDIRDVLIQVPGAFTKHGRIDRVKTRGIIVPFEELPEGGAS